MQSNEPSRKQIGDAGEDAAVLHLERAGLRLLCRNYRTPGRGGGEIDLIMREPDGTLVFVEVRLRSSASHGGAAASITARKRQRIVFAARHYLMRCTRLPSCRFDVVSIQAHPQGAHIPPTIDWLRAAFDAD